MKLFLPCDLINVVVGNTWWSYKWWKLQRGHLQGDQLWHHWLQMQHRKPQPMNLETHILSPSQPHLQGKSVSFRWVYTLGKSGNEASFTLALYPYIRDKCKHAMTHANTQWALRMYLATETMSKSMDPAVSLASGHGYGRCKRNTPVQKGMPPGC